MTTRWDIALGQLVYLSLFACSHRKEKVIHRKCGEITLNTTRLFEKSMHILHKLPKIEGGSSNKRLAVIAGWLAGVPRDGINFLLNLV